MIQKKIFGEYHANVAGIYNNLALVHNRLGEYNQAKELQEKALVIRKKIFGEDHSDVETSYNFTKNRFANHKCFFEKFFGLIVFS